jgi:hypothetical protein
MTINAGVRIGRSVGICLILVRLPESRQDGVNV